MPIQSCVKQDNFHKNSAALHFSIKYSIILLLLHSKAEEMQSLLKKKKFRYFYGYQEHEKIFMIYEQLLKYPEKMKHLPNTFWFLFRNSSTTSLN